MSRKRMTRQAHAYTNFTHCSKNSKSPRKVCVVYKKNKSRRKGGLCDTCFVDNGTGLCVNCTNSGYKHMPWNTGGLCTVCITNRVKVIKNAQHATWAAKEIRVVFVKRASKIVYWRGRLRKLYTYSGGRVIGSMVRIPINS